MTFEQASATGPRRGEDARVSRTELPAPAERSLYTIHCDQVNRGEALCGGRRFNLAEARRKIVQFEVSDYVIYRYYLRRA